MAGKEYRAKSKIVQKMSRDGLVEENLQTGKSRRAVTGRIDAVRIGDRPMETVKDLEIGRLSEEGETAGNGSSARSGRDGGYTENLRHEAGKFSVPGEQVFDTERSSRRKMRKIDRES